MLILKFCINFVVEQLMETEYDEHFCGDRKKTVKQAGESSLFYFKICALKKKILF